MKHIIRFCGRRVAARRILLAALALSWAWNFAALAGSSSAESNVTTVDTTGAGLQSISGRVLDGKTRLAIAGATVTYAGSQRTADDVGRFQFSGGSWPNGQELGVSKTGYASVRPLVQATSGTRDYVVVPDILPAPAGWYAVLSIKPKYDGLFLSGAALLNEYTATVSWGGRTPGMWSSQSTAARRRPFQRRVMRPQHRLTWLWVSLAA